MTRSDSEASHQNVPKTQLEQCYLLIGFLENQWSSGVKHDVYISAGIDDAAAAMHICAALEAEGISCWIESRDRDPRLDYLTIDSGAVTHARLVIAIHSSAGDHRARVIDERRLTSDLALPTIAVDAADIPDRIKIAALAASVRSQLGRVLPVRIFLYSPPGSEPHRTRLLAVLPHVVAMLGNRIRFEPILWEETPALTPSQYDIVVFFSGTHLHTVLPGPVGPGVWLKITHASERAPALPEEIAGALVLYFNDELFNAIDSPELRIEALATHTADLNRAIDAWLRRGTLMPQLGYSMAGNPPPQFENDAKRYLTEFGKRSLAKSLNPERSVRHQTKPDIAGRFTEPHLVACYDSGYRPPPPSPPTKASKLEKVHFCAFAPTVVAPGADFILQIWACRQSDEDFRTMLKRAAQSGAFVPKGSKEAVPIQTGTWLTVSVAIPAFGIDQALDRMYWDGDPINTSFVIAVPRHMPPGTSIGTAIIHGDQVPIALLHFEIATGTLAESVVPLPSQEHRIKSIFASYASQDRLDVLRWTQGAETLGVEVFVDVLTLRAGSNWAVELFRQVPVRDLFCLFWSKAASESVWVEREWRCALAARGLDYIHPVPLVDPRTVPPPPELGQTKHFNDPTAVFIEYERNYQDGEKRGSIKKASS